MPMPLTGQHHNPAHARPAPARAPRRTSLSVLALMASLVFVVAAVLTLAATLSTDQAALRTGADAAWTARLDGLALQHQAQRQARADAAWTARLDGLALRHQAQRQARADAAWTARLEGLAGDERN